MTEYPYATIGQVMDTLYAFISGLLGGQDWERNRLGN